MRALNIDRPVADAQLNDTESTGGLPCVHGHLTKRGSRWPHRWQRRYFLADGGLLAYAMTEADLNSGRIKGKKDLASISSNDSMHHGIRFVDKGGQTMLACAKSLAEQELWLNHGNNLVSILAEPGSGATRLLTSGATQLLASGATRFSCFLSHDCERCHSNQAQTSGSRPHTNARPRLSPHKHGSCAGGVDDNGRDNHSRVAAVNTELQRLGLRCWFDEEQMTGDVDSRMAEGIDQSDVVVCFITQQCVR